MTDRLAQISVTARQPTADEKLADEWFGRIRDGMIMHCREGKLSFEEAWEYVSQIPEPDYSAGAPPDNVGSLDKLKPLLELSWNDLSRHRR
ncbi:MAG: hypothetical protein ABJ308_15710 [Halieaceae bacterium]